jgi:hypothetical protein
MFVLFSKTDLFFRVLGPFLEACRKKATERPLDKEKMAGLKEKFCLLFPILMRGLLVEGAQG